MPDVNPIIAQLQATVNALTSGGLTSGQITDDMANKLLKDRPDVLAEFNLQVNGGNRADGSRVGPADRNSPVFTQKGLDSPLNYARYWYSQMGGSKEYSFGDGTTPATPEDTAKKIEDDATKKTDDAVTNLTNTTNTLIDQLKASNTSLTGLISTQADNFSKSQADLLAQLTQAKSDSATQMGSLMDQLQSAMSGQTDAFNKGSAQQAQAIASIMNANGQVSKKPNYARALAQNKVLNSTGLGSTMLTGPAGVSPTALTLGFTNLLGA